MGPSLPLLPVWSLLDLDVATTSAWQIQHFSNQSSLRARGFLFKGRFISLFSSAGRQTFTFLFLQLERREKQD